MSTLNSAQTLSALNVKASAATSAGTKANPLPTTQGESSKATFSRLLERSRADAAAERHASSTAVRQDAGTASTAHGARHAVKEDVPRGGARTDASRADGADTRTRADGADTRTRASTAPRGRDADTAHARASRTADDDAASEPTEAAHSATDEDARGAQADATTAEPMPTPAGAMLPVAHTATPLTGDGAAATDPTMTDAASGASPAWPLLGKAGGRIGAAGPMGAGGPDATPNAASVSKEGPAFGQAPPMAALANPALALDVPAQPVAVPEAALAQLAALSGHAGPTDEARKLPSALEVLPAGSGVALAHSGVGPLNHASDSPALPTATLSTAVTDPGFQDALATQVSVFARGGLSKAELHLNPAELGPVSVQITMNGDQARVDFGADRAQTRQAIEAGWAALAASLQDAGFTLSGGGVSEQAGRQAAEQQAAAQTSRSGRSTTAVVSDPPATSVVAARPRAGAALDLYA